MGQGSGLAVSCGVGCRPGLDPAFMLLWCRPASAVLIPPLPRELLYATGVAIKSKRPKKKKKKKKKEKKKTFKISDV